MATARAHPREVLVFVSLLVVFAACSRAGRAQNWIAFNRASSPSSPLQCFSPSNVTVSGGDLILSTKAENATCSSFDLLPSAYRYTSGFVAMRTFNFLYGTVEFRAKFGGAGSGAWPAVWMADASCQASDPNGTDNQCNGQEIDIAEIMHGNSSRVNEQIHVDNFTHNDGCTAPASNTSENFHVYQLIWGPGSLVFKIDGATTCVINQPYVPRAPMYIKTSVFAGAQGGTIRPETLPWSTLIDYVKVTEGGKVIFDDEFNDGATIQPGSPGNYTGFSGVAWLRGMVSRRGLRWTLPALAACVLVTAAALALRRTGL
ncbi:MAG TPA: glycoside hydrolase family 16 protein [Terracidiphilus sp.]|nr:glycoside hydrolase family 16 protein [Terracidiphilus sp.]